jgi:hypothetical protein
VGGVAAEVQETGAGEDTAKEPRRKNCIHTTSKKTLKLANEFILPIAAFLSRWICAQIPRRHGRFVKSPGTHIASN